MRHYIQFSRLNGWNPPKRTIAPRNVVARPERPNLTPDEAKVLQHLTACVGLHKLQEDFAYEVRLHRSHVQRIVRTLGRKGYVAGTYWPPRPVRDVDGAALTLRLERAA